MATPPSKKARFTTVKPSPNVDARCWSTYNDKHNEINTFARGTASQATLDAAMP